MVQRSGNSAEKTPKVKKLRMHDLLMKRIENLKREEYSPLYNLVLRDIADHYNWDEGYAWPSAKRISRRTWISEGHVRVITSKLKRDGLLTSEERDQKTNLYSFPYLLADVEPTPMQVPGPPPAVAVPPFEELQPPTDKNETPYSEDSRTVVNLHPLAKRQMTPLDKPNGTGDGAVERSVIDFPSGEAEQKMTEGDAEHLRLATIILKELKYYLPTASYESEDLQKFVQAAETSEEEFAEVIYWAINISNFRKTWPERIATSEGLNAWFDKIRLQRQKFYKSGKRLGYVKDIPSIEKAPAVTNLASPVQADNIEDEMDDIGDGEFGEFEINLDDFED